MIVFGTIAIAILFAIFLVWKFRQYIVWWEIIILLAVPTAISFGTKALVESTSANFTEYLGDEVVNVYEEEPYNEWDNETCSREVACGTDKDGNTTYCTEYYDCSHQDDYGPKWYAITKCGSNVSISEYQYDKWNKQFGSKRIKVDTKHNYDASDRCCYSSGSKFEGKDVGENSYSWRTDWDGAYATSVPLTSEHTYINKIKASDYSVFKFIKISEDSAKVLKLYDYPDFNDCFNYPSVLGYNNPSAQNMINRINGHLGKTKQVRVWVLVHNTADSERGWQQECYWIGGNKNEIVINIGVIGNQIKWCHVFSWSDVQSLKDDIEKEVMKKKVLDTNNFATLSDYIHIQVEKRFERLEFKQFDYLTVEPPTWTVVLAYIFTILVCIGIVIGL